MVLSLRWEIHNIVSRWERGRERERREGEKESGRGGGSSKRSRGEEGRGYNSQGHTGRDSGAKMAGVRILILLAA